LLLLLCCSLQNIDFKHQSVFRTVAGILPPLKRLNHLYPSRVPLRHIHARFFLILCFCALAITHRPIAQGNYEIQVYGSDTFPAGSTMTELHSNFTANGSKTTLDGTYPTKHQEHEKVEITQGWNSWLETGFYIFTSAGMGRDTSGWDTTSARAFAFPIRGSGRWG
jgi:hypothetical protein